MSEQNLMPRWLGVRIVMKTIYHVADVLLQVTHPMRMGWLVEFYQILWS
jgi:hypothetical protein